MKSAEEWTKQYNKMLPENYGMTATLIEEIQLDAAKWAMRRAAMQPIVLPIKGIDIVSSKIQAILNAAEKLNKKDL
jgi:hypothetical protein